MVLVPSQKNTPSIWVDYHRRATTMKGLIKELNEGVKSGEYLATRFIKSESITYGILPDSDKPF